MGRPSLRLFVALLVVALPPLVAYAAINVFAGDWLLQRGFGAGTQLLIATALTLGWAALVAVAGARVMAGEARTMLELAERGTSTGGRAADALSEAQRRLAATLEERNRQIASLADTVRRVPIVEDAASVARSMAAAARELTGDPTWVLVVLRAPDDRLLPPGVYAPGDADVAPVDEVHRWASTVEADEDGAHGARQAIGPWGAFVIIDVAAGDELRAILMAPREGRPPPAPAELALLSLLGQHAATAVEHALLYARLRAQADELNRMAAVQTDFLRGVTHDLQTPLTSIRALASELRSTVGTDAAAAADLDTIAHQADRLRRMVGQLLAVSRLEAGALTPSTDVFRAEPLVRRTWDALRADRPFTLTTEGEEHLVVGDPDRLEQVLWAVLDNAVKYSPDGSPIELRLAAARRDGDGALQSILEVTDNGAGMDPATQERAFEQFYRSADARRLAPDGSGVGLYAARGLLRAMGGDIRVSSRLGVGTTVRITMPAESAAEGIDGATDAIETAGAAAEHERA
ncbi:MAG TPA: HAMP domain-containing sensor histidine kinase [candidate division Zixibacteria bacterium]|nr:HAMP domain-containing sensor histidine kinase [candidate division Zixibacteria bacterium]